MAKVTLVAALVAALAFAPLHVEAGGHGGGGSSHNSSHASSHHSTSTKSHGTSGSHHRSPAVHISSPGQRDSHGRLKRSSSAKTAFKHAHTCPSTGKSSGACPGYVIDHVKALKHGGADDPSNMQWQTTAEAKAKDRWE
jgi:hypothetical protein